MAYVLVLLVAAAAGVAVGLATLRTGLATHARPATWSHTYEVPDAEAGPDPAEVTPATAEAAPAAAGRRTPLPTDPTLQTRLTGVLGLLIVCLVAAASIVAALYAVYLAVRSRFGG